MAGQNPERAVTCNVCDAATANSFKLGTGSSGSFRWPGNELAQFDRHLGTVA